MSNEIREIDDDTYNNSLFVSHADEVVDATLYVFNGPTGDKFTVWGAGYRNTDEASAKDTIAKNVKSWLDLDITNETITVSKVNEYKPTHVADTDPLVQMLFGIKNEYLRKEV